MLNRRTNWSKSRRSLWRATTKKYPDAIFYAKTSKPHPSPTVVKHAFSSGLDQGGPRYWAFESEQARDRFVQIFANAELVESNPCP